MRPEIQTILRRPFDANQISQFPRNAGSKAGLSYVGHAALTDRLLQADPNWTWEPVADPSGKGLPLAGAGVEMWIALTIDGTTRYGYGDAQNKKGGDAIKEAIGDALRNAAMRFGVALDLWHKGGDLYQEQATSAPEQPQAVITADQLSELLDELKRGGSDEGRFLAYISKTLKIDALDSIPAQAYGDVLKAAQAATARKAAQKAGA
jgi:hypothetical protein